MAFVRDLEAEAPRSKDTAYRRYHEKWRWHDRLTPIGAGIAAFVGAAGSGYAVAAGASDALITLIGGILTGIIASLGLRGRAMQWERRCSDYEYVEREARGLLADLPESDSLSVSARLGKPDEVIRGARKTF